MAIDLHKDCVSRLIESISENLAKVRVNNDVFLQFDSTLDLSLADEILPKSGSIKDKLNKYIGDIPLFDFLYDTIGRDIYENGTYNSDNNDSLLTEISGYSDVKPKAEQLISEFKSLPWQYAVSFELNNNLGKPVRQSIGEHKLSDHARLVCPYSDFDSQYPLKSGIKGRDEWLFRGSGLGLRSIMGSYKWNEDTTYLQLETQGFIGRYGGTNTFEDVLSTLKSFFGLSLAVRLMKIEKKQLGLALSVPTKLRLIIHRKAEESWEVWTTYELPNDLSEVLNNLAINDLDGKIDASKIKGWITNRILHIALALENPSKSERLLLAGEWLLDSYVGKNELLSFVQTTVAMEILLGEKSSSDIIGIGELLRNRCAYLIGKSHSQRASILKDFDKIYKVRSNIVHRGKSRLNYEEKRLFRRLQWMCRRVINEELNLLLEDKKEST